MPRDFRFLNFNLFSHITDDLERQRCLHFVGFYSKVRAITAEEEEEIGSIEFDMQQYKQSIGVADVKDKDSKSIFIRKWCKPSLSIHNIESSGTGGRVISKKVSAKISIRHVPDQSSAEIIQQFTTYVTEKFQELKSCNTLAVKTLHTGDWWLGDRKNKYYRAAAKAIEEIWNAKPINVREGGTIPVTPFLEKTLQAPALHLPIGSVTDKAHLQNERIRVENLVKGKDVLKNFFNEIAKR
jgi:di- and tripeptidase